MPAKKRVVSVKDRLPPKGQWVIAVTPGFRCMAYLDEAGKWRDVNRGKEIKDVQGWCPPDDGNKGG
jgi:hypothetical protein